MSRKPGHVPSYRLHKPSGQARVIIDGEHIYLGPYGSPESHERYARLIAERAVSQQNGKTKGTPAPGVAADLLVCQLVLKYDEFAKGYYIKDIEPGKECTEIKLAMRPLLRLYGNEKARDFGPLALKAVRQSMVDSGLSRGVVNRSTATSFYANGPRRPTSPPRTTRMKRTTGRLWEWWVRFCYSFALCTSQSAKCKEIRKVRSQGPRAKRVGERELKGIEYGQET